MCVGRTLRSLTVSGWTVLKLHILSDLHRDLAGEVAIPNLDADVVLLAGDIDGGFDSVRWANWPNLRC